ncbi:hypothetical protein QVD17_08619 [Tagetes erecta]|uniref:MULE transposase domain-containing protein n=1 Tax=Tagetes erecta TaxID=13708 RepID=A0AAD8P4C2_TARER|nr:hypothetical protein QVD17_08619 [Tagetes erecta]
MAPPIFAIPNFDSSSMNQDYSPTTVFNTPNGTLSWIPNVPTEFKHVVGMKFSKMDNSIKMYTMIFVPFTGIDNHKRCVTYGAGLLFSETIESYTWLLDAFPKTHCKHSLLVLTDQDPAMKQAVASVFTQSRHRLCMWHIMKKASFQVVDVDGLKSYTITHVDKNRDFVNDFTLYYNYVKMDPTGDCISCSCMSWTRIGYLRRHIFYVFRFIKVDHIPDKYICSRWRCGVLPKSVYNLEYRYGGDQSSHSVRSGGHVVLTNHLKTVKRQILENIPEAVDSDDPVEDVLSECLVHQKKLKLLVPIRRV